MNEKKVKREGVGRLRKKRILSLLYVYVCVLSCFFHVIVVLLMYFWQDFWFGCS